MSNQEGVEHKGFNNFKAGRFSQVNRKYCRRYQKRDVRTYGQEIISDVIESRNECGKGVARILGEGVLLPVRKNGDSGPGLFGGGA